MRGLGRLERRVMDALWATAAWMTVREVYEVLVEDRPGAYTTVLTVLDNLHAKSWVDRERRGRAWVYRPSRSREEAGAEALREVLEGSGDARGVLLHFAREMDEQESELLRRALDERGPR